MLTKTNSIIISSMLASVLLTGCFNDNNNKQQNIQKITKQQKVQKIKPSAEKNITSTAKTFIPQKETNITDSNIADNNLSKTDAVKKIKERSRLVFEIGGNIYFKQCASCHGFHAEKKAFDRVDALNTKKLKQIEDSLLNYKAEKEGGKFRDVMYDVMRDLNKTQITYLSEFISKLGENEMPPAVPDENKVEKPQQK